MSYGLRSYQQTRTKAASREDILIMLYEGAIRFLERSIGEFENGKLGDHKTYLSRGRAIVEEFQNTLDWESGGEITIQLNDLYTHILDGLTEANMKQDMEPVRRAIIILGTLLDGWRGAVKSVKEGVGEERPPEDDPGASVAVKL